MVCWVVNGLGEGLNGPCWEDQALMSAFIDYTAAKQANTPPTLCMVSGDLADEPFCAGIPRASRFPE